MIVLLVVDHGVGLNPEDVDGDAAEASEYGGGGRRDGNLPGHFLLLREVLAKGVDPALNGYESHQADEGDGKTDDFRLRRARHGLRHLLAAEDRPGNEEGEDGVNETVSEAVPERRRGNVFARQCGPRMS